MIGLPQSELPVLLLKIKARGVLSLLAPTVVLTKSPIATKLLQLLRLLLLLHGVPHSCKPRQATRCVTASMLQWLAALYHPRLPRLLVQVLQQQPPLFILLIAMALLPCRSQCMAGVQPQQVAAWWVGPHTAPLWEVQPPWALAP